MQPMEVEKNLVDQTEKNSARPIGVLLDPRDELLLRHEDAVPDVQGGEPLAFDKLIRARPADAERIRLVGDGQHQREVVVVFEFCFCHSSFLSCHFYHGADIVWPLCSFSSCSARA